MKQIFFYILPLLLVLIGCRDDYEEGDHFPVSKEGKVQVPFSISMPAQLPKTYALDENDENEVRSIDILAFKVNGNDETFAYRAQADQGSIVDDGVNNKKKFVVTLFKDGSQTYRFVTLANAKDELDNTFAGGITVGTSKEAIMQQLQLTDINKWNVNNGTAGYLPIPMWGETPNSIIIQDNTTITDLKLLRMVAKINVKIDPSISENSFALSSVSLYNYYSAGRIVPDAVNLVTGSSSTVEKPTVIGTTTKGPIDYEGSSIVTNNSIINNIYTFESTVPKTASEVNLSKVTTLVLGGKYNGSTEVSYYRVDIVSGKTYLDILRNHLYTINITKVKSAGYRTKEDAFNSRPINIEAEVVVWDEAAIGNIEFDGQFMLAVSQGKFDFTKSAYTTFSDDNTVSIKTDYKSNDGSVQGWKVTSIIDDSGNPINDWLKTSVNKGDANVTTDMQLILTENNSGANRLGYITISAGRLAYKIEVRQSMVPPLELRLKNLNGEEINELIFESQTAGIIPASQQFVASWMPIDRECSLTYLGLAGKPFSFGSGSDTPGLNGVLNTSAGGTGKQTFTIFPAALTQAEIDANPLIEKASKIDFTLSNGAGFTTKTIYLRQIRYGLQSMLNQYYILDNSQQSMRIKSNSLWKIRSVSDAQSLLVSFDMNQNGGYNVADGDLLLFTLRKPLAEADLSSEIIFTFFDPAGKYQDVQVKIKPVACGINGVAVPLKIGNNNYLTHMYGDKCWMVENSREGTPYATSYGGSVSGTTVSSINIRYKPAGNPVQYYYSSANAYQACPSGWHLATATDVSKLRAIVNLSANQEDLTKGVQYWVGSNVIGYKSNSDNAALTGGLFLSSGTYYWRYWSETGYWWIEKRNAIVGDNSSLGAPTGLYDTVALLGVRCVQD